MNVYYRTFPERDTPSDIPLAEIVFYPWGDTDRPRKLLCYGTSKLLSRHPAPRKLWGRLAPEGELMLCLLYLKSDLSKGRRLPKNHLPIRLPGIDGIIAPPIRLLSVPIQETPIFTLAQMDRGKEFRGTPRLTVYGVNAEKQIMVTDQGVMAFEYREATYWIAAFSLKDLIQEGQ